jgi:hypothetical protein
VLIVRGTKAQIAQVREMLGEMGEAGTGSSSVGGGQRIRRLQYTQGAALSALSQIQRLMPELGNRIRVLSPSGGVEVRRPATGFDALAPRPEPSVTPQRQPVPDGTERTPSVFEGLNGTMPAATPAVPATPPRDRGAAVERTPPVRFASQEVAASDAEATSDSTEQPPAADTTNATGSSAQATATAEEDPTSKPIIIVPGPSGLVVVSDDVAALNELEELLSFVVPPTSSNERQFAVFYLRYTAADTASAVLSGIYGTGGNAARGGGGRGGRGGRGNIIEEVTGQLAEQLAGSAGSAITGLISGATGISSTAVDIVPLIDHNAILVRAKASDLDMIEQIIEVLDQRSGPVPDQSDPEPRRIAVRYMAATEMKTIIESVYADRIAGGGGGGGGGNLSTNQIAQLFGAGGTQQEPQKMTITVDDRTNQLIVRAPDLLFEKVKTLVEELDQVQVDADVTRVVPVSGTALLSIRGAIEPLASNASTTAAASNNNRGGQAQGGGAIQQIQQAAQIQGLLGQRGGAARGGGGGGAARGGGGAARGGAAAGGRGGGGGGGAARGGAARGGGGRGGRGG